MWPSSINRWMAPRETAGNLPRKKVSNRSEGSVFSMVRTSVREGISNSATDFELLILPSGTGSHLRQYRKHVRLVLLRRILSRRLPQHVLCVWVSTMQEEDSS